MCLQLHALYGVIGLYPTRMLCRGIPRYVTGCPCGVCVRGSTACQKAFLDCFRIDGTVRSNGDWCPDNASPDHSQQWDLKLCGLFDSIFIQVLHMFNTRSVPELMLTYYQLDPLEHISMKLYLKFTSIYSRKCFWKCHLYVQTSTA